MRIEERKYGEGEGGIRGLRSGTRSDHGTRTKEWVGDPTSRRGNDENRERPTLSQGWASRPEETHPLPWVGFEARGGWGGW